MPNEKIVLPSDPEAAQLVTVQLWQAGPYAENTGRGMLYKDEHSARFVGSTHRICEGCGKAFDRRRSRYVVCDGCMTLRDHAKYEALPLVEWDGTTPLCIFDGDDYFFAIDDIDTYLDNNFARVGDSDEKMAGYLANLQLVVCEPEGPHVVDADCIESYLEWDSDRDGQLPQPVLDALKILDSVIQEHVKCRWRQGKQRVKLTPGDCDWKEDGPAAERAPAEGSGCEITQESKS
jgi:hypothetical protein